MGMDWLRFSRLPPPASKGKAPKANEPISMQAEYGCLSPDHAGSYKESSLSSHLQLSSLLPSHARGHL